MDIITKQKRYWKNKLTTVQHILLFWEQHFKTKTNDLNEKLGHQTNNNFIFFATTPTINFKMSNLNKLKIHDSVIILGNSSNEMGNFTSPGSTDDDCNVRNAVYVDKSSTNKMKNFTNTLKPPVSSTHSNASEKPKVSSSSNKKRKDKNKSKL